MTNLTRSHFQAHPFHLVSPSPWPIYTSIALLTLTTSGVLTMHGFTNAEYFLISAFVILILSVSFWWRDVISKERYIGNHTLAVQRGLNMGVALFIVSEALSLLAIFWAFFHSKWWVAIKLDVPGKKPIYIPEDGLDADTLWDLLNGLSLSYFLLLFLLIYIMKQYLCEPTIIDLTPVKLTESNGECFKGMIDYNSNKGWLLFYLYTDRRPGTSAYMVGKYVEFNGERYFGLFREQPLERNEPWFGIVRGTFPVEITTAFSITINRFRWIMLKELYNVKVVTGSYYDYNIDPLSMGNSTILYGSLDDVQ